MMGRMWPRSGARRRGRWRSGSCCRRMRSARSRPRSKASWRSSGSERSPVAPVGWAKRSVPTTSIVGQKMVGTAQVRLCPPYGRCPQRKNVLRLSERAPFIRPMPRQHGDTAWPTSPSPPSIGFPRCRGVSCATFACAGRSKRPRLPYRVASVPFGDRGRRAFRAPAVRPGAVADRRRPLDLRERRDPAASGRTQRQADAHRSARPQRHGRMGVRGAQLRWRCRPYPGRCSSSPAATMAHLP